MACAAKRKRSPLGHGKSHRRSLLFSHDLAYEPNIRLTPEQWYE